MATNALKLSTMVGENLDIYLSNGCNCPQIVHHGWRKFRNSFVSNGYKYPQIVHHGWRIFRNLFVSNGYKCPKIVHHGWRIYKFTCLRRRKMQIDIWRDTLREAIIQTVSHTHPGGTH